MTYAATLALGFVFDDHVLILENGALRSWRYLPAYFASNIWFFHYPHLLANYYRPLFLIWLRLNYVLFGLRPWGWHLTSVLAHLAVTYLVYRLALRLTGDLWVAGIAGLLFGLHPVHAEAVADVTSIQEPLTAFFILAALLAFARQAESASKRLWMTAALLCSAAALLSKESGLMLPVLILGFTWFHSRDETARTWQHLSAAVVASVPFWLIVAAYVPLRIWALKGFAHVIAPISLRQDLLTVPSVLVFYLRLMVWPADLSCYYDTPYVLAPGWQNFALPLLLLVGTAAVLALWYGDARRLEPRDAKTIGFAALVTIVTVLPVVNFRYLLRGEIAHDRYIYLPSVGFLILVALGLRWLTARKLVRFSRKWAAAGVLVLVAAMGYATARQCLYWSDDLTLNNRAHQIAPHNVFATTSLAAALGQLGMERTATALYQQALAVDPDLWRANLNLGYIYYRHGDFTHAAQYLAHACDVNPTDGDEFLYLGTSLLQMGQLGDAERAMRTAILARPEGKGYHLGLGVVLKAQGRLEEAKKEVAMELAGDPGNAAARQFLEQLPGR